MRNAAVMTDVLYVMVKHVDQSATIPGWTGYNVLLHRNDTNLVALVMSPVQSYVLVRPAKMWPTLRWNCKLCMMTVRVTCQTVMIRAWN